MRRLVLPIVVLTAASTAGLVRATGTQHQLVGSYSVVTRIQTPRSSVTHATLTIDTYERSTGLISGHGSLDGYDLSMTGTVRGTEITMRVATKYPLGGGTAATALDQGTVQDDGTIKGTIHANASRASSAGTWVMTPFAVIVAKSGWSEQHLGHQTTLVSWGVVLKNISLGRDAVTVKVDVEAVGANGRVIPNQGQLTVLTPSLSVVPAGQIVYLGDGAILGGAVQITGLRISVTVGTTVAKRSVLPPVSHVQIDPTSREITASVTNPYQVSISPYDYQALTVFYGRSGRIIGGDTMGSLGAKSIKPGARATIEDLIPDGVSPSSIAFARITVMPR
jgi:hypothetical protein